MKLKSFGLLTVSFLFLAEAGTSLAAEVDPTLDTSLTTLDQKLSYVSGTELAATFERIDLTLDYDSLILAINDAMADIESRLTTEEIRQAYITVQEQARVKQENAQ
jgi:hypothetical protein